MTYVITIRNSGTGAFTNLTVTDDLGGGTNPSLTYEAGTALYFVNGVPQAAPAVTAGPPLVFTGINVPAGGDAVIVYQARANDYAAPTPGGNLRPGPGDRRIHPYPRPGNADRQRYHLNSKVRRETGGLF